jgi:hypothetical protein
MEAKAAGGMARSNSRRGEHPISFLGPLDRRLQFGRVTWFCHPKRKPVLEAWPGRIVRLGDAKSRHRVPGVRAEFLVGQRERLWCRADDPVLVRQQARHMQMEQPG